MGGPQLVAAEREEGGGAADGCSVGGSEGKGKCGVA